MLLRRIPRPLAQASPPDSRPPNLGPFDEIRFRNGLWKIFSRYNYADVVAAHEEKVLIEFLTNGGRPVDGIIFPEVRRGRA